MFLLIISSFGTGCIKRDTLEDITIYTTSYPIEYITSILYGEHSSIYSIYPNGIENNNYQLNEIQIKEYSKTDMYVFNGLSSEKDYLTSMIKYNNDLMIIDATNTMEYTYSEEELWLDPSNFLMMALNIKNGLTEYITNHYLKEEINENYNNIKIEISNIDANLKLLSENVSSTTIVVDNNVFKYLEKYGFTIISLDEKTVTNKIIADVNNLISSGKIKYIFTIDKDNLNDDVQDLIDSTNIQILEFDKISNLTDEQRSNKETYISILNNNINLIKTELYD
ncbi:MAG: metal ABC transporter substrate-binding protein [Bacilli bacterium]